MMDRASDVVRQATTDTTETETLETTTQVTSKSSVADVTFESIAADAYYSDDSVVILHGDCREVLPVEADVIVTDPPYGISWQRGENKARNSKRHEGIANDDSTLARDEMLRAMPHIPAVVFGSFYAQFPADVRQVLVWHKPADSGLVGSVTGFRRDAEPVFLVGPWPIRTVQFSSVLRTVAGQAATTTTTGHPHTKPVALIMTLIGASPLGTILDPFMGSGTTLVAAKNLGRKAIGIEIEERYCEIAAKRCSQEVLAL